MVIHRLQALFCSIEVVIVRTLESIRSRYTKFTTEDIQIVIIYGDRQRDFEIIAGVLRLEAKTF